MSTFYENESEAVQEYLSKLGADSELYNKALSNYQKLIVCKKLDSEVGTKMIEAEAKRLEAEARLVEANNKKLEIEGRRFETIGRIICTVIEAGGRLTCSCLGFEGLLVAANYETDGTLSNKLVNMAGSWVKRPS